MAQQYTDCATVYETARQRATELQPTRFLSNTPTELQPTRLFSNIATELQPTRLLSNIATELQPTRLLSNIATELQPTRLLSNIATELQPTRLLSNIATELQPTRLLSNIATELQPTRLLSNTPTELQPTRFLSNIPTELQPTRLLSIQRLSYQLRPKYLSSILGTRRRTLALNQRLSQWVPGALAQVAEKPTRIGNWYNHRSRSQWPCGLRRRSAAERLLGSWVRIPWMGAWMFVSFTVFVL
jgi:hypothetical protein